MTRHRSPELSLEMFVKGPEQISELRQDHLPFNLLPVFKALSIKDSRPLFSPPVYSYVPGMLAALRDRGAALGIISNTGSKRAENVNRVLSKSGIFDYFNPELLIYSSVIGLEKNLP